MSISSTAGRAIDSVTEMICHALMSQKSEEAAPSYDADKSDDLIQTRKEQVLKLRAIRNDIEEIATSFI